MSTSTDSAVMEHKVSISSVSTMSNKAASTRAIPAFTGIGPVCGSLTLNRGYIYILKGCAMILSVPAGKRMMEYKALTFIPLGVKKAIFQEALQEYILCTLQDDHLHFPDFNLRIKEMRRDDEYSCPAQGIGQKALDSEHQEPIAVGASLLLGTIPSLKLEPSAPSWLNICLIKICAAMHDVLLVLSALTEVVYGGNLQMRRHNNRTRNYAAAPIVAVQSNFGSVYLPSNYLANKVKCKTTKYHNTSTGLWLRGPGVSVHPLVYCLTC